MRENFLVDMIQGRVLWHVFNFHLYLRNPKEALKADVNTQSRIGQAVRAKARNP